MHNDILPHTDDPPDFERRLPRLYPTTKIFLALVAALLLHDLLSPRETAYPDHIVDCIADGSALTECIRAAHPAGTSFHALRRHLRQMGFVRLEAGAPEQGGKIVYTSRRPGQIFAREIGIDIGPDQIILDYPKAAR